MKITGIVKDKDGTLPSANIYVSDEFGNVRNPIKGTSTDVFTGVYTLDNLNNDAIYITASYVGYKKAIRKISELQGGDTKKADFLLVPESAEIPTFELIEDKPIITQTEKRPLNPMFYVGMGLVVVSIGYLTYTLSKA